MIPEIDDLGRRLRGLRRRSFKSQSAFARHCEQLGVPISRSMIANWEVSRSVIPAQMIPFLANALKARVTDLLPDLGKPAPVKSNSRSSLVLSVPPKNKSNRTKTNAFTPSLSWLKQPLLKKIFSSFFKPRSGAVSGSKTS